MDGRVRSRPPARLEGGVEGQEDQGKETHFPLYLDPRCWYNIEVN